MNLKELFSKKNTVIADGAMGTYFSVLTGLDAGLCEKYNVISPDIIRKIHSEYISAGAEIIRTNTFSANTYTLGINRDKLRNILVSGYNTACESAGGKAVVCADISAIYDTSLTSAEILDEYKFIADTFIECGAGTFIFETLPSIEPVMPAIDYIISVMPDAEIITSFTLLPDGRTRSGVSVQGLLKGIEQNKNKLTMVGLNCGCGAVQLFGNAVPFFNYIHENTSLYTGIMPNSGYPSVENKRTVFNSSPLYFARETARFLKCGVSVLGGCCGTVPQSIQLLKEIVQSPEIVQNDIKIEYKKPFTPKARFSSKLADSDFIIAAELDPPDTSDLSKIISAAGILKKAGVDIITVSDSPLGHAKADPVICSSRIKREIGIDVLPHICCRDRNINALRSILLGMHSEGIRAVLAVTGDHIAETDRGIIKPVFNLDSVRLMELINTLNEDIFSSSPIAIGGAYDPEKRKMKYSLSRLEKKIAGGAKFVLTQPVFSLDAVESIENARSLGIKVLVGIMPLVSFRNAMFMKNEVPGISIPDELAERFKPDMSREEAARTGIEISVELARKMRPHADGFYFITPFNRAEIIKSIIEQI